MKSHELAELLLKYPNTNIGVFVFDDFVPLSHVSFKQGPNHSSMIFDIENSKKINELSSSD